MKTISSRWITSSGASISTLSSDDKPISLDNIYSYNLNSLFYEVKFFLFYNFYSNILGKLY